MTNEEKAKAYDEALKWMRELYPGLHGATKEDAEHYFPELRESEDERIRKELVNFLQSPFIKENLTDEKVAPWVAYLEKQKEQEHICDSAQYEEGFKTGLEIGLRKQKEQKPAWSEEDEKMIDTIVSVLGQYIDYKAVSGTGTGYATPRYSKEIDWLKSIRPSWKPSDQDELMKLKYAGTSTKLD